MFELVAYVCAPPGAVLLSFVFKEKKERNLLGNGRPIAEDT